MRNILHDWSDEVKKMLFKKAFESLNDYGVYMIIEDF